MGCYYQQGAATLSASKVLNKFQQTYTTGANLGCSTLCTNQIYNFYGVTDTGTGTNIDCYCGDTLSLVTIVGLGSGAATENNCALCLGGPVPAGDCGSIASSTVAIYARAF